MAFRNSPQAPVTLLWHDYETTGLDKARDRPMQFAGIRTDLELNILGDPTTVFCKLAPDTVPDPAACLLTGISPQRCEAEGLNEAAFANAILEELGRPGTCGVGYNTMRFDDEFTRHLLFRTVQDPYEREWANGNSRWDIVDLVRAVHAFRPSVMEWPIDDAGKCSFRLEELAGANGLPKVRAHDALSDVETTIALARLILQRAPELYHLHFGLRLKKNVAPLFDFREQKPLFHVSSLHGVDRGCVAPVIPLAVHPDQANAYIVFDLSADPTPLIHLSAEEIADRVFRAEKGHRLPLTVIHSNRAPVLLTPEQVRLVGAERIGIGFDKAACAVNWKLLREHAQAVQAKVQAVYGQNQKSYLDEDPELCIYGGFASNEDRRRFARLKALSPQELAQADIAFDKPIYAELLFRHRARNWPETLDPQEQARWRDYVRDRLVAGGLIRGRTLEDFAKIMGELEANPRHRGDPMLPQLRQWARERERQWVAPSRGGPTP